MYNMHILVGDGTTGIEVTVAGEWESTDAEAIALANSIRDSDYIQNALNWMEPVAVRRIAFDTERVIIPVP